MNMRNNRLLTLGMLGLTAIGASAEINLSDVVGDSPLYGYLLNDNTRTAKWNKISADGTVETLWEDENLSQSGIEMQAGWMRDGILCGFGLQLNAYYSLGFGYMERNVVTGEIYSQKITGWSSVPKDKSFSSAVYKKGDDAIYGYGSYDRSMAFKKTSGNGDYTQSEVLFELTDPYEWCPSLCVDPASGQTYGITLGQSESLLLSIDNEGFSDVIATLPVKSSKAVSALAYFPATGYFLWSNTVDSESALYAIRLADGYCEKISDLEGEENYVFFVTDSQANGCGIPAMPELLLNSFEAPATSGSLTYVLPSTDLLGNDLETEGSELTWVATLDNEEYQSGVNTMGSTVRVEYEDLASGIHTFGLYVEADGLLSDTLETKIYIGYDRPAAPQNVTLELSDATHLTATWDAVTTGVNGGYVDLSELKYKVFLNENLVGTVTESAWSGDLDPSAPLTANVVTVIATSHDMDSASAESNTVVAGQPLEANVTFAPTKADAALMTYPDDNGLRWKYNTSFDPAVFSVSTNYGSDDPLNTWLIFPAINFPDAGDTFKLEYQNGTYASYCYGECYEIWIGREPTVEAMTTNIKERTEITPTDGFAEVVAWNDNSLEFMVPEPGVWHIGFKACPDADNMGQILLNIRLSNLGGGNSIDAVAGEDASRVVAAYYDAQGVRIAERPAQGLYITVYTDGTTRKCVAGR